MNGEIDGRTSSADGTPIAFDRSGSGPPLVIVGGAFSYRRWKGFVQLAGLLGDRFTVIRYDRRGRGDSGDTLPYSVEREIEDLDAVVDAAGGSAHVWGLSSGGVLAMRAAIAGVGIDRLSVYEPPFLVDDSRPPPPPDFEQHLAALVAAGRRGKAAKYFMRAGMGIPAPIVAAIRLTPVWSKLQATANTLPYEWKVLGDTVSGEPLSPEEWSGVTARTLVVHGGKTPAQLRNAATSLAGILPAAELRVLEGQSHNVSMKALAPVLADFFGRQSERRPSEDGVAPHPAGPRPAGERQG